jgi:chromosome segregation ATPase
MPAVNSMLCLFGLATRRQLETAVDRKNRWHGLVRNVFVPYYLKFQETALGSMPELPVRYTSDWDRYIQAELDSFLALDLESVGELLDAAGFGAEKWERIQETGFPALSRLLDEVASADDEEVQPTIRFEAIDAAVSEDVVDLLSRHPDLAREVVSRIDLDTGRLQLTDDDVVSKRTYQQILADLETARTELRRFRRGGRRALDRIHQLEVAQLLGSNGDGQQNRRRRKSWSLLPATTPSMTNVRWRSWSALPATPPSTTNVRWRCCSKDLRARDSTIDTLRGEVDSLEHELSIQPDPDKALEDRAGWLERELESRDDQVVRLQTRIEALQDELDAPDSTPDESDEMRQLRADLKAREHEIEKARAAAEEVAGGGRASDLDGIDFDEDADSLQALRNDLKARDFTIEGLRAELERAAENQSASTQRPDVQESENLVGDVQRLTSDLKARDHTIASLQEQLEKLESDASRTVERTSREPEAEPTPVAFKRDSGPDRQEEIEAVQRDLRAREATIVTLREQLETFERELGQSLEQLMQEVKKLAALAAGENAYRTS